MTALSQLKRVYVYLTAILPFDHPIVIEVRETIKNIELTEKK